MTEAALSEVNNGSRWSADPSFSVADALLADPKVASVLRKVLRDGHAIWFRAVRTQGARQYRSNHFNHRNATNQISDGVAMRNL